MHGMLKPGERKPDPRKQAHLGGLQSPAEVVKGMPVAQSLWLKIFARWERFCREKPKALEVAETYGTRSASPTLS